MTKNEKREHGDVLYEAILTLKDLEECKKFFSDLCTVAELRAMEQRFEVAMLLSDGMIYNDILERTGASSATISRVNRSLQYGADGYQAVLPRIKEKLGGDGIGIPGGVLRRLYRRRALCPLGRLSGEALRPQPAAHPHGAGSGLRHREPDPCPGGAGL